MIVQNIHQSINAEKFNIFLHYDFFKLNNTFAT